MPGSGTAFSWQPVATIHVPAPNGASATAQGTIVGAATCTGNASAGAFLIVCTDPQAVALGDASLRVTVRPETGSAFGANSSGPSFSLSATGTAGQWNLQSTRVDTDAKADVPFRLDIEKLVIGP